MERHNVRTAGAALLLALALASCGASASSFRIVPGSRPAGSGATDPPPVIRGASAALTRVVAPVLAGGCDDTGTSRGDVSVFDGYSDSISCIDSQDSFVVSYYLFPSVTRLMASWNAALARATAANGGRSIPSGRGGSCRSRYWVDDWRAGGRIVGRVACLLFVKGGTIFWYDRRTHVIAAVDDTTSDLGPQVSYEWWLQNGTSLER